MRRLLIIFTPVVIALILASVYLFVQAQNRGRGALQVTALPKSNVYLNEELIGQTPLCKCEGSDMVRPGEYSIKIEPQVAGVLPFEEKITVNPGVLTVVDRSFGQGATSEGSIITLSELPDENAIELLVTTFPDRAQILLDNNVVGESPLLLKDITDSDHELKIVKSGYKEKVVRIRATKGYKLTVTAFLGISENVATDSATNLVNPTPTSSPPVKVQILETPTGFLRVRENADTTSAEVGRVFPGEEYDFVQEENEWFQIRLTDGTLGWVTSEYTQRRQEE